MKIIIQNDEGKILSTWSGIHADEELPTREDLRVALQDAKPERVANVLGGLLTDSSGRGMTEVEVVQSYLPGNYSAMEYVGPDGSEMIQIRGRDNAGWTMDAYVIPRLASGNICAREVE